MNRMLLALSGPPCTTVHERFQSTVTAMNGGVLALYLRPRAPLTLPRAMVGKGTSVEAPNVRRGGDISNPFLDLI